MAILGGTCVGAKRDFLATMARDVFKLALYTDAAMLNPQTQIYTPQGEVVAQGYDRGGKVLTGLHIGLDQDVAVMGWRDPVVWENASITAHGALIYNASRGNRALVVVAFGKPISSTDGPFRLRMPPVTAETAVIRIF